MRISCRKKLKVSFLFYHFFKTIIIKYPMKIWEALNTLKSFACGFHLYPDDLKTMGWGAIRGGLISAVALPCIRRIPGWDKGNAEVRVLSGVCALSSFATRATWDYFLESKSS